MKKVYLLGLIMAAIFWGVNNKTSAKNKKVQKHFQRKEAIVAGIDHIGINVLDIDSSTIFLQKAFDAKVIYESYSKKQPPLDLSGMEGTLNIAAGTKIYACRMIKIGNGPTIELFEIHVDGQRKAIQSSDIGLQHFAVYCDNISESIKKFVLAGGKILSKPNPILFPEEKGDHNFFCYGLTPWGTSIEFITYPDKMPYENHSRLRRWKGGKSGK